MFGRTLVSSDRSGRSYNDRHALSLLCGVNVRPGVVGGVAPQGSANAYSARCIDGATGAANDRGDVPYSNTLASYAKTLAAASGMSDADANSALRSGKVVSGALVS